MFHSVVLNLGLFYSVVLNPSSAFSLVSNPCFILRCWTLVCFFLLFWPLVCFILLSWTLVYFYSVVRNLNFFLWFWTLVFFIHWWIPKPVLFSGNKPWYLLFCDFKPCSSGLESIAIELIVKTGFSCLFDIAQNPLTRHRVF